MRRGATHKRDALLEAITACDGARVEVEAQMRYAIALAYVLGRTMDEISAKVPHVSRSTVKRWLRADRELVDQLMREFAGYE